MADLRRLPDLYHHGPPGGIFEFRQQLSKLRSAVRIGADNRLVAG
jgi:hypothetical protein